MIPFSVKPKKILSNLRVANGDLILSEEMEKISKIDKNCRLIKGQVFLWEHAKGWEDLWDLNNEITK